MNPRMMTRCGVALLAAVTACNGGIVGLDRSQLQQGDEGVPDFPTTDVEDVQIQPLSELSIDWVKRLPGPDEALGMGISAGYFRVLQADKTGKLVLFYRQDNGSAQTLQIARLSDKGEVEQEASVTPPESWNDTGNTQVGISPCGSATCINDAVGLKVSWWKLDDPTNESWTMQKLIFSDDITQAPQRKTLTNGVVDDLLQAPDGAFYAITGDPAHNVTKQDAAGKTLWKADHFEENSPFGKGTPDEGRRLSLSAVALDDGRLVVMAQPDGSQNGYVLYLDAQGKRTDTQTYLMNARYLLNGGDHAVTLGQYDNGDLLVLNVIDEGHNQGVKFVREDYTLLFPEAAAIDPSGNVYFATHNGSRSSAQPTLCRAAVSGGGDCYTLPLHTQAGSEETRFDGIVARDDGELYIHSGFDLIHVSYPK